MSRYRSRGNAPATESPRERKSGGRGKRGGIFVGLMMGLVLGLVAAAGVAAYLYLLPALRQDKAASAKPTATPQPVATKPEPSAPPTLESSNKPPAPDYTFYRILQGSANDKAPAEVLPREQYWLQVAALKSPADADRLKAKLALLGMDVAVQKVDNVGAVLHRVRVGPFKTESAAMGALDTLAANQFEPRLIKEPANQR
ncbi:MAG: SPOR domain-containing protein [Betaproteobacteria bacterium]|nr:SPOR domain-containing protein [Betaproteobacteria bacterium]